MMNTLSPLRLLALVLAAALTVFAVAACDSGGTGTEPPDADFDRAAMLDNYAANVILPAYEALDAATSDLNASAEAFADAPSEETLAAVRADLKAARLAWQDASFFAFGPADRAALQGKLNTYPADEDRIEDNVAAGSYTLGALENNDARGFPALGYLLYGAGSTDANVVAAFADADDAEARAQYLRDNAAFVQENVAQVVNEWSPDGGDYRGTFTSEAMAGTDTGSAMGMLINAFVKHYERVVRDGKIGIPAGVRSSGVPRPQATEAHYAGYSAELARASVRTLRRVYVGDHLVNRAEGLGLDDNLQALGAGDLDAAITDQMDASLGALDPLSDPLAEQIETNNEPVLTAFQEMQGVTALLKADMTSILGITITFQDNDGD